MSIFITSDLHLGHNKSFIYKVRGFETVEEMNAEIIRRWNSVVGEEDDVFVLGDLVMGSLENLRFLEELNGRIHIVRGNHDTDNRWEHYKAIENVVEMENSIYLKYGKYRFYLSHYPAFTGEFGLKPLKSSLINLCGHTHTTDKGADYERGIVYHCEVDAHDCTPVPIEKIIEDLEWQQLNGGLS